MVILIGGASHTGKTLMAQKLLEIYHYPTLSIDHLKMGLYRADCNCGFTPTSPEALIAEKLWPVLRGIIMTVIENRQNLIIEGCYLPPGRVLELDASYQQDIIALYLVFSRTYIERYYQSRILGYRNAIETRAGPGGFSMDEYIAENTRIKENCQKNHVKCFEIHDDYNRETQQVYAWMHHKMPA